MWISKGRNEEIIGYLTEKERKERRSEWCGATWVESLFWRSVKWKYIQNIDLVPKAKTSEATVTCLSSGLSKMQKSNELDLLCNRDHFHFWCKSSAKLLIPQGDLTHDKRTRLDWMVGEVMNERETTIDQKKERAEQSDEIDEMRECLFTKGSGN